MKGKSLLLAAVFLAMSMFLGGCGGDDGDDSGGGGGGGLATGTFTKTIDDAVWGSWSGMFNQTAPEARYMMLFEASDVAGSGKITSLKFKANTALASSVTCTSYTIKMAHALTSSLSATYDDNVGQGGGAFTTVLNNASVTIPAVAIGDFFTINLTTPFNYNGVDNLLVQLTRGAGCSALNVSSATAAYTGLVWAFGGAGTSAAVTGTPVATVMNMQFVFAGGVDGLDYGGVTSNYWPLSNSLGRAQYLYLADEINGGGPITGLGLQLNAATVAANRYTVTVKLADTLVTTLSMTWADNYTGTQTTVASNMTFTVPNGLAAGEYFWVPLTGSFTHDATKNLLVDIDVSAGTGNTTLRITDIAGRRVPGYHTDGAVATGLGQTQLPNVALRFNGGTMDFVPINLSGTGDGFPFYYDNQARQWLFLATDLGTSGSINSLSCRNWVGSALSTAQTYTYKIVMGHLGTDTLSTVRADNLTASTTVFNSTISMPAGLQAGDYFSIPLSTSFSYNGKDNLVIDISGTGSTTGNFACELSTDARYAGRRMWDAGGGKDATTMTAATGLPSIRLGITK